jgi:glutamine phosphoribosylpyrophosphate amidotransferase
LVGRAGDDRLDTDGNPTGSSINEEDIFTAIGDLTETCKGAYACVAMLAGFGLIAFRDPNGIRPMGLGTRPSATSSSGSDYLVASESVVADALGFSGWEDVKAGEAIIITRTSITRRQVAKPATFAPDIFEYVYFARPDSTLDGISVYRSRMAMGDMLAAEAKRVLQKAGLEIDVVIPVGVATRPGYIRRARIAYLTLRMGIRPGSRHIASRRPSTCSEPQHSLPRRFREEPLCRSDVHHAGTDHEVSDGLSLKKAALLAMR